ncbi:MAG: Hsp20/alpha crystallin family protein [Acidobacteria bacterium]|nr:MAG: Hsp20/alpha crystallin family protein [Acidobacteriota bacterium]
MIEKENIFYSMFRLPKETRPSHKLWYPAADVYEVPDGWIVKLELAGVSAEDIKFEIHENILHISGIRRDRTCKAGITYRQMEITYSRFEKTLSFPEKIDTTNVEHNYADGLLYIYLKKRVV